VRVISIRYKYRASFVCLLFSSSLFFFPFPRFLEHATTRSSLAAHVSQLCRRRHNAAKFNHHLAPSFARVARDNTTCSPNICQSCPDLPPREFRISSAHRRQMSLARRPIDPRDRSRSLTRAITGKGIYVCMRKHVHAR